MGWTEGQNVRIDIRWAGGDADLDRKFAAELVALIPDVILATASPTVAALQGASRTVPIVFAHAVDPVGAGFVDSLSRPGGNATGFVLFEYGISAKWLELLKEIAPSVARWRFFGILLRPPERVNSARSKRVAPSFGVEFSPVNVRDPAEIDRAVSAFARSANCGLIVTASPLITAHRDLIIALAARHKLPAIYYDRFFANAGGLISSGTDIVDQYRRAAGYVDRILKGERPADQPVQAPTKFELVINLKTAKALGLAVPTSMLAHAAVVIE